MLKSPKTIFNILDVESKVSNLLQNTVNEESGGLK